MSQELLQSPPAGLTATVALDEIHVRLPARAPMETSKQLLQVAAIILTMASTVPLLVVLRPTLDAHTAPGTALRALVILVVAFLPHAVVLFGILPLSLVGGGLRLTQHALVVRGRRTQSFPLEEIESVSLAVLDRAERGWLCLQTPSGAVRIVGGLNRAQLRWLAQLIRHHVARRQIALQTNGAAEGGSPPPQLTALLEQPPTAGSGSC